MFDRMVELERWVRYACRYGDDEAIVDSLTSAQLVAIGEAVEANPAINVGGHLRTKTRYGTCRRCGTTFRYTYRTRRRWYCNRCSR